MLWIVLSVALAFLIGLYLFRRYRAPVPRAFVRYFCRVTPATDASDPNFIYFKALKDAGAEVRVIAINLADFSGDGSLWAPFHEDFTRTVPDRYINVICGSNVDLARLFTVGTKNIAIPTEENFAIKEFDAVLSTPPNRRKLVALLRKFI